MNLIHFINYQNSKTPIEVKENKDLIIMSFNIRCTSREDIGNHYYKVRMPYIKKVLEEYNPDVIGFQEVKVPQFKYLLKILQGYDYEYTKRDTKIDGEANPVFYKKKRFTLLNKNTFWLSDTYKEMSNTFKSSCFRICSYVRLLDHKVNKEFYVFNTHLDHRNEEARIKGVKLIKKIIKEINNNNCPHLIIGDMNDFYNSKTINELFLDHVDASKINNKENEITFHDYGRKEEKIDYMALSKDIKILDYKVITNKYKDIYPSDHYPIEVIIKL